MTQRRLRFTPEQDQAILDGRAAGRSWREIGLQFGTTGKACQYRVARILMMPDPKPVQIGRKEPRHLPSTEQRGALRPGAPESWQAITAGTVLDGRAFR